MVCWYQGRGPVVTILVPRPTFLLETGSLLPCFNSFEFVLLSRAIYSSSLRLLAALLAELAADSMLLAAAFCASSPP